MTEDSAHTAPWHLWLIGGLALVWNAFGAADYLMTQIGNRAWFAFMGFDEATTTAALAWMDSGPWWADAAWAFGVWGGVAGSLLLLLRNRWAVTAFGLSIAGVVASMVYQARAVYPPELAMMDHMGMMYMVLVIALGLLFYSASMRKRGMIG